MLDQKKWSIAYIKFKAYYANVPSWIKTPEVAYYHELVSALEQASGEDLSHFKIPADRVKPKVVGAQRGSYRGGLGRTLYSSESYCDNDFFKSQLDALNEYLKTLAPKSAEPRNKYDDLQDWQLEELMVNRRIKPKRELINGREEWVAPREYIIAALIRQDNPSDRPSSTVINNYVTDSNFIQNSPGASITEGIDIRSPEFATFVENLLTIASSDKLSPAERGEINMHIGTIQLHINSPTPSGTIVKESLKSIRGIFEKAAVSMLTSGFLASLNAVIAKIS
jgi:hypothetical protein